MPPMPVMGETETSKHPYGGRAAVQQQHCYTINCESTAHALPLLILYINKKIKSLELYFHFHILKSHSLAVLQRMSRKLGI